ncbi:MAG: MBOAT family protein [Clostridia bacterium]|nr:MBOAT family protein [Clostridia bacterium]
MVFSSLVFLCIFLPVSLLLYYLAPNLKAKNIILTLLSILFYAWGEPVYFILMIVCSYVNYLAAKMISSRTQKRKPILIVSLIISLGFLVIFKYAGLIAETVNLLPFISIPVPQISLPIGISFYTFQALSYTLDIYSGREEPQKRFGDFLLYVSLFPQLIAGPILRYRDLASQLTYREHTMQRFYRGTVRFSVGLCKKVIIANHAGELAGEMLAGSSSFGMWYGIVMFAVQIYFDFSGYSDMAIGLGRMFGFEYTENFNYPYISRSVTEFWRRWHISLGTWFRDYIYIPMGGKYKHQLLNIFTVWALTGIWHGASWNFLFWGLYYGILLAIEKTFLYKLLERMPSVISWLYTMLTVLIGWTLFYFTDITQCFDALKVMFSFAGGIGSDVLVSLKTNVLFLGIAAVASTPFVSRAVKKYLPDDSVIAVTLGTCFNLFAWIICTVLLVNASYNPFLYFRF